MKIGTGVFAVFSILLISLLTAGCASEKADGEENKPSDDSSAVAEASKDSTEKKNDEEKEVDLDAVPVEVVQVSRGNISDFLLLSSTLETEQYVDVFPYLTGIVETILAEEGDDLKKGDPLLKLEDEEHRLAEAKARVAMKSQESEYRRLENLYKKELLSKEEYDKAKFAYEQTHISWQQAKLTLDRTTVRAPIDGILSLRNVRTGDKVMQSTHLFSMVNLEDIVATVYVPEKELSNLRLGQRSVITSDYLEDTEYEGFVKRISPVIDPLSGTFKVTIGLNGKHVSLRPGMFVNTYIITQTNENVLLLPKDVIVYDSNKMFVFIITDSVASKVAVKVGFQDAARIEITEGVSESDQVIIVGQSGLKDKAKIKVVNTREVS